uniref:Uncharacterized protein n=1 Tax=Kalanchoe fedtschenkoi TaxID=63787 RepID=A0A7N0ZSX2_KALFE
MGRFRVVVVLLCIFYGGVKAALAEDPYLFFTWNVTYGTLSPLGVPQQVILINGLFPGPNINSTSNNNIVLNIYNNLDDPFLISWNGIQQRKNSWQDGVPGTNCPILPGKNYTDHFQVKDQIGSYYYFPSTAMHKAAAGYGGLRINSRLLIPVPYPDLEDDYTVLAGDWYTKSHKSGKVGNKSEEPMFTMKPGKTYKYRNCNVGLKNSINFRIQGHGLRLVEFEGSHTLQNTYDSLDVHLGQCYGVLVEANQKPGDYYLVVSSRITKRVLTATRILRYTSSRGQPASPILPVAPVGWAWSLDQFRSFRWNLTTRA